ncbi:MAG: AI-2E family transporter [Acidobacteria bacterium]|nr:AI-2E family transporter [Acidobacteriota bacterium]
MKIKEHFQITGTALKRWLTAQTYDALLIGLLWLAGLLLLDVPLAPLWAFLGMVFQFIPYFGTILAMVGPAVSGALSGGAERLLYVMILYALIVVVDGLLLQPYLMRRVARVPIWASILVPLLLGSVLSVWGVLLAVPLLVVIYAYRIRSRGKLL